jgi:hypothetical protein
MPVGLDGVPELVSRSKGEAYDGGGRPVLGVGALEGPYRIVDGSARLMLSPDYFTFSL